MNPDFLSILSGDLTGVLETEQDSDLTIQIGQEPNVEDFHLHRVILRSRSNFFSKSLENEGGRVHHLPMGNIDSKIFKIILSYIYGGILDYKRLENTDLFDVMALADDLEMPGLVDFLDEYTTLSKKRYITKHYATFFRFAREHPNAKRLNKFCSDTFEHDPTTIFYCEDFNELEVKTVVDFLANERLHQNVSEIEIFEKIKLWGMYRISGQTDQTNETPDGVKLKEKLVDFLPYIRFDEIPFDEFADTVLPVRQIFSDEQLDKIWSKQLKREGTETQTRSVSPSYFESNLLNEQRAKWISKRINSSQPPQNSFWGSSGPKSTVQLEPRLILRGTQNGFSAEMFHRLCDNKGPIIVIFELEDVDFLVGGYRQSNSTEGTHELTKGGFVFSLHIKHLEKSVAYQIEKQTRELDSFEYIVPDFLTNDSSQTSRYLTFRQDYKSISVQDRHIAIREYEVYQV